MSGLEREGGAELDAEATGATGIWMGPGRPPMWPRGLPQMRHQCREEKKSQGIN
jgi:hypothetical protein